MAKFGKGKSGNPAGRKPGTGYAGKLREAIAADLPDILKALIESAKNGDTAAAKVLLDRSIPAFKPIQTTTAIDDIEGKSLSEQGTMIINAMGAGALSPEQAHTMLATLANLSKVIEGDDIERRLTELERQAP